MMLRTPGLRRRLALGVPALVLAGIGCGGEPSLQPPEAYPLLNTTVVSEPTSVSPATPAAGVAYVSLPPGAYPDGVSVSIVNPANGNQGG